MITTSMPTGGEPPRFDVDEYGPMLEAIRLRFEIVAALGPVFETNAGRPHSPSSTEYRRSIWETFLAALPEDQRRHHDCHACRHFVDRCGGLAAIADDGSLISALWSVEPPTLGIYAEAFAAVDRMVRRSAVTGVYLTDRVGPVGLPENPSPKSPSGTWRHMHVVAPRTLVVRFGAKTADQIAAEKAEDLRLLRDSVGAFDAGEIARALGLARADALFRSEKVVERLEWLADVKRRRDEARGTARDHLLWLAAARAPAGWCHVRSSIVGSLLESIAAGEPIEVVQRKFREKMDPLAYLRPKAAPSAGAIAAAERLVEQLGITRSLPRRFARVDEIEAIWRPGEPAVEPEAGGVFGHLKAPAKPRREVVVAPAPLTFEKFRATKLPDVVALGVWAPSRGNYMAFVAAEDAGAPPIFQWDDDASRNPFSVYTYKPGSPAAQWGIPDGWNDVTALSLLPWLWDASAPIARFSRLGVGAVFVIAGAVDSADAGLGLFPECLRSELHEIRSTIEAHSNRSKLGGRERASACGIGVGPRSGVRIRATDRDGQTTEYTIDRWD